MGLAVAILSGAYLVSMMFALGLELGGGPKESKEEKRRGRRTLVRALVLNLVVLPLIALGIARAMHLKGDVTVALLILVAAPGGRYAPQLVKLARGNVALAVEVALFLAKLTGFTVAPTVKWMLTLRSVEVRELPFILQLLVLQLVPYYFGRWVRRAHRPFAEKALGPAHLLAVALMIAVLVTALAKGDTGIGDLLHDRAWLAVLAVILVSPLVGWLAGGARDGDRRALAVGANTRELALALVVASVAFPGRGVHAALFAIWSLMALASGLLAWALRGVRVRGAGEDPVRAAGRAPAAPAAARSVPGH
jgi:bile acid:Na+ symporter, BASS family